MLGSLKAGYSDRDQKTNIHGKIICDVSRRLRKSIAELQIQYVYPNVNYNACGVSHELIHDWSKRLTHCQHCKIRHPMGYRNASMGI